MRFLFICQRISSRNEIRCEYACNHDYYHLNISRQETIHPTQVGAQLSTYIWEFHLRKKSLRIEEVTLTCSQVYFKYFRLRWIVAKLSKKIEEIVPISNLNIINFRVKLRSSSACKKRKRLSSIAFYYFN